MAQENNELQEVLEAIDERERRPDLCAECRGTADGLEILAELLDSPDVPHPWVCTVLHLFSSMTNSQHLRVSIGGISVRRIKISESAIENEEYAECYP